MSVSPPVILPPPSPVQMDVARLIDSSRPRPVFRYTGQLFILAIITLLMSLLLPLQTGTRLAVQFFSLMILLGTSGFISWLSRAHRNENQHLDTIEDLLSLKRPAEAAPRLEWLMSRPMRSMQNRLRAMMLLAAALGRQHRYEEVLTIDDELIDHEGIAGPAAVIVKLGRALAMLHADRLYDADCAINELRRTIDRGPPNIAPDPLPSAALRLVEIYRDVKTGHDAEAIEHFRQNRALITQGLAHRAGEAYALVAYAYHRLGMSADATDAMTAATTLQPAADLLRTYPELRPLLDVYPPAHAPQRR
ncbi:MAG TPA: hypothetical protein VGB55_00850 [Tepidisphaeraceae bacterium]|jgi:hypothetical protein